MTSKPAALLFLICTLVSYYRPSRSILTLSPSPGHGPLVAVSGTTVVINCLISQSGSNGQFIWQGPALQFASRETLTLNRATQDNNTRSTLTIYNITQSEEGFYTCMHTAVPGVSVGIEVQFNVYAYYRQYLDLVQNYTIGENATLLCPAFLGDPPGLVSWSHGGIILSSDEDVHYNTSGRGIELKIFNVQIEDSGVYRCQVYRDIQGLLPPQNITINVFEKSSLAPVINKTRPHRTLWFKCPLDLTCDILTPNEPVDIVWYYHGPTFTATKNATLHLEPTRYLSGEYQCHAFNSHGSDSFSVFVVVQSPPRPPDAQLATITAWEGTLVILVYLTLLPPIDYSDLDFEWMHWVDGEFIPVLLGERITKTSLLGQLAINNSLPSDSGDYQVNISNLYGFSLQRMSLEVLRLQTPGPTFITPTAVNYWFQFKIVSELLNFSQCLDLKVKDLMTALDSQLCNTSDCDVMIVDELICSSERIGQFWLASAVEIQQNTFNLAVNGFQLAVTFCGTSRCPIATTGPSIATESMSVALSLGLAATFATVGGILVMGTAIFLILWKCSKRYKSQHSVKNPVPSTPTIVPPPQNSGYMIPDHEVNGNELSPNFIPMLIEERQKSINSILQENLMYTYYEEQ